MPRNTISVMNQAIAACLGFLTICVVVYVLKIGKPILGTVNMLGWRDLAYYQSDPWRGTWKGEGGGVLINQAPHQLDLLLWYMGEIDELGGDADGLDDRVP